MRFRMIERCRDTFPILMMCRCLQVSPAGYYAWRRRPMSERARDNLRLLGRIEELHEDSDGVKGSPRIWDDLRYEGESCGLNRVTRLMREAELRGIPQRRRWRNKPTGERPDGIVNRLQRDFSAETANTKWVTDITRADARADVFDYIECFHNPRRRRRLVQGESTLTKPSTEMG